MVTTTCSDKACLTSMQGVRAPARHSLTTAYAALVVGAFLLLTLPPAILRPFHSKGEPREVLVSQAMLNTANWILPQRYQDQIATKPPMAHWMIAAAALVKGNLTEFSARLPSLAISFASVLALFFFLASRTSPELAVLSSLTLMTSALWYRSSISCRVDMLLAGFMVLALLLMYVWAEREYRGNSTLTGIIFLITYGILTKGPVALILPALIWISYQLIERRNLHSLIVTSLKLFLSPLLLSSIWYLLAYSQGGSEFLHVVWSENVARMTGEMTSGKDPHQHSVLFLIGTLFAGTFPWCLLIFVYPWRQDVGNKRLIGWRKPLHLLRNMPNIYLYFTIVCVCVFGFYCIPSSKKAEYLLPLYPFLSGLIVAVASHFSKLSEKFLVRFSALLLSAVLLVLSVLSVALAIPPGVLSTIAPSNTVFFQKSLPNILTALRWTLPFTLAGTLYLGHRLYGYFYFQKSISWKLSSFSYIAMLVFIGSTVVPPFAKQLSAGPFAEEIEKLVPKDAVIVSRELMYGLDFYLGGKIKMLNRESLSEPPFYALVSNKQLNHFEEDLPSNRRTEVIATAPNDIGKPGRLILLVRIY